MPTYESMSNEELLNLQSKLKNQYDEFKSKNLKLDMSRGKPGIDQLDISMEMMDILNSKANLKCREGIDCRNYGVLDGIGAAKELVANMLGVTPEEVIIYGNSSLNVMYDTISRSYTHGILGSKPWCKYDKVKFLCPVPGYDRHFSITEHFGIEMINIKMNLDGPDMDTIEDLVSKDDTIKGIWCVPKYSNPLGITFSDEVVKRFANLKPKAKDFRIMWDNAYAVHDLYDNDKDELLNIMDECKKAGNPDIVIEFCSTSKISFPGSGIAAIAASETNIKSIMEQLKIQTIGSDKLNQLRHVRFYKTIDGLKNHMKKHASILRPKFQTVLNELETEIKPYGIGNWVSPKGGYFISFNTMKGCAKKVVSLCNEAGVVMTEAGATYPYKKDPDDSNIRIAPTYPDVSELEIAVKLFTLCVKLASIDKILSNR